MAQHISTPFPERSNRFVRAVITGDDGITPIGNDIVTEMRATLRNLDISGAAGIVFEGQDVLSSLGPADGAFALELVPANLVAAGSAEHQLHLLTVEVTHSSGRVHHEEITFYVDQMQDVPLT